MNCSECHHPKELHGYQHWWRQPTHAHIVVCASLVNMDGTPSDKPCNCGGDRIIQPYFDPGCRSSDGALYCDCPEFVSPMIDKLSFKAIEEHKENILVFIEQVMALDTKDDLDWTETIEEFKHLARSIVSRIKIEGTGASYYLDDVIEYWTIEWRHQLRCVGKLRIWDFEKVFRNPLYWMAQTRANLSGAIVELLNSYISFVKPHDPTRRGKFFAPRSPTPLDMSKIHLRAASRSHQEWAHAVERGVPSAEWSVILNILPQETAILYAEMLTKVRKEKSE